MSIKRTAGETITSKGGGGPAEHPEDDDAKRVRLILLSDTTLQDLPMELIELILIKVVVAEVMDLKLVKSVWKEKADLAIAHLGSVCTQWLHILTTNSFRIKLHRILDGTAEQKIRLEILHQLPLLLNCQRIITLKDEIFVLLGTGYISVFERNDMTSTKSIIRLEKFPAVNFTACSASICLYVLFQDNSDFISVARVATEDGYTYSVINVIKNFRMARSVSIVTTQNGSLVLHQNNNGVPVIWIFSKEGLLIHQWSFGSKIPKDCINYAVMKSNGNLFLITITGEMKPTMVLSEVDMEGRIIRQKFGLRPALCFLPDGNRRLLLSNLNDMSEVVDDEFNVVESTSLQLEEINAVTHNAIYMGSNEENFEGVFLEDGVLSIYRLTEE